MGHRGEQRCHLTVKSPDVVCDGCRVIFGVRR